VAEEGVADADDEDAGDGGDGDDDDQDEADREKDEEDDSGKTPITVLQPDREPELDAGVSDPSDPLLAAPPPPAALPPSAHLQAMKGLPPGLRCDPEPGCDDDVCLRDDLFLERCEEQFYLDHGIPKAHKSSERTDAKHLVQSVLVNATLALVALLAAGLFLRRKSH
jgi:hypothetical protein